MSSNNNDNSGCGCFLLIVCVVISICFWGTPTGWVFFGLSIALLLF
jgi:hypothetical protein